MPERKECFMMTLADTVELMNSDEYKKRFIAEYLQTKIRYDKLHRLLVQYEAGTLGFITTCPVEVLRSQAHHMGNYLMQLEIRAEIEGIDLESFGSVYFSLGHSNCKCSVSPIVQPD